MSIAEVVTLILLALQPYFGDGETPEDRRERIETIASSIDTVAMYGACEATDADCDSRAWVVGDGRLKRLELTAALMVVGRFESGYARHVHENKCRLKIGECDNGRARSPWQFQRTDLTRVQWWAYRGADQRSTDMAAYAAAKVLGRARVNCGSWEGAFAQYATGGGCHWKWAPMRASAYEKTLAELRAKLAAPVPLVKADDDEEADEEAGEE